MILELNFPFQALPLIRSAPKADHTRKPLQLGCQGPKIPQVMAFGAEIEDPKQLFPLNRWPPQSVTEERHEEIR